MSRERPAHQARLPVMIDVTAVIACTQVLMPPSTEVAPPNSANTPRIEPGLVMVRKKVCGTIFKCGTRRQTR